MSDVNTRAILFAQYIIRTKATIRKTAEVFAISKSTVHNDLQKRLVKINKELYTSVKKILDEHFKNKHINGGNATKEKYKQKKHWEKSQCFFI